MIRKDKLQFLIDNMDDIQSQINEFQRNTSVLDAKEIDWSILLEKSEKVPSSRKLSRWNTVVQIAKEYKRQLDGAENHSLWYREFESTHFSELELIAPNFSELSSALDIDKAVED